MLINVLTGRGFRRVSPWVQMALMGVLIVDAVPDAAGLRRASGRWWRATARCCAGFRRSGSWHSIWTCCPDSRPEPAFHELAALARQALAISAAAFALTYLAGYRRHARRVMESVEGAEGGPGRLRAAFERAVNRWLLPHPLERATFHFISNTILRNARQRLFLATYGGIAVALALPAVVRIGTRPGVPMLIFHAAGLAGRAADAFLLRGLRPARGLQLPRRIARQLDLSDLRERGAHAAHARRTQVDRADGNGAAVRAADADRNLLPRLASRHSFT